ncbi:MAG: HAMP domain-containing protein [Chryseolinea sp.]
MKIAGVVLLSFSGIMLLFSVSTYLGKQQKETFQKTESRLGQSGDVLKLTNRFQRNFISMVSGLRGYLLTNETSFIQTYDSALQDNKKIGSELATFISVGSEQRALLEDIIQLERYWVDEFAVPLISSKKVSSISSDTRGSFNDLYRTKLKTGLEQDVQKSLQKKFHEFAQYEYNFRNTMAQSLINFMNITHDISLYLTFTTTLIGICISIWLSWYISSRVKSMVSMAKAISDGDYNVRTMADGKNEFNQLGKALNQMAVVLRNTISKISKQRDELDQFAHIISQDLRAPLNGITNMLASAKNEKSTKSNSKLRDLLEDIEGEVLNVESRIKGLLSYASAGGSDQYKEVVEVEHMLDRVKSYITPHSGVRLIVQQGMPTLYTEKLLLEQVLTNLVLNAIVHDSLHDVEVCVFCREEHDMYLFYVQHIMAPSEDPSRQRMFLTFTGMQDVYQFEQAGIGLPIAKKIISERGLQIKMSIEPGKRYVFCFNWPKNEMNEAHYQHFSGRG